MKRPQGFDHSGGPASGPFATPTPPSRTAAGKATEEIVGPVGANATEPTTGEPTERITKSVAAPIAEPITEPLTVLESPIAQVRSEPAASGSAADGPAPSRRAQVEPERPGVSSPRSLRQARRDRKRYEREEVKRFTRRARRRRMVWLISLGSVVVVLGGAVLAAYSPLMALHTIDVVGTARLKPAVVARALDGQLGKPLPLIDFAAVKKELGAFALIRSYSTETHPPGTLVVRIVERAPVGLLKTGAGFQLVDPAGVVITTTAQRPAGYPVIQVAGAAGKVSATPGFAAATGVLSALPPSVLSQVDSVSAQTANDVALTLIGGKTVLWGGPDQSDFKAADLAALLKDAPAASLYDVSAPQSPVTK
ncbi:FtsQ-type POTRA domain-containing protein [Rathayibacter soli]|uniref:FtsQ-type POTRA domain-containing protein n=1 Tax=Rathayibacter soli TaxID=3144168 RepID=UPI0027E51E65|nr:FtsQ-type POTRA domain-containing protein [Glaciibacter superstes]